MFLDHTRRCSTVGRTPLDEWSARRRDLYLTTHDTHNRQISMPPVGFEPKMSAGEQPQAARLLRSWVRIPPVAWIFVCCECRLLSGRGLFDELITRPEESYRLWRVVVYDLETSRIGAPYIYDSSNLRVKNVLVYLSCYFSWSHPNVFSLSRCIPRVSSVKIQLIYCQLKWRHVSTQGIIIRPIIEPCLMYIKWKWTSGIPNVHFYLMYLKFMYSEWVQWVSYFFFTLLRLLTPWRRKEQASTKCWHQVKVHIWGPKCVLSLYVPQTRLNKWPDDDSLSRNMSPL